MFHYTMWAMFSTLLKTVSGNPDFLRNLAASMAPTVPVPAGSTYRYTETRVCSQRLEGNFLIQKLFKR